MFIATSFEEWQLQQADEEASVAYALGNPYTPHAAVMGIMNESGSGKMVRVRRIEIIPQSSVFTPENGGFYTHGTLQIQLLTAVSSGYVVQPSKADTTMADPPAEVIAYRYPGGYAVTGNIYNISAQATWNTWLGLSKPQFPGWNGQGKNTLGALLNPWSAGTQKILLAEGEGLGLYSTDNFQPSKWDIEVVVSDGANQWLYSTTITVDAGRMVFALTNDVGSGVVLQVLKVTIFPAGDLSTQEITIEGISAIREDSGAVVVPVSTDTAEVLPAGITVKCNPLCIMQNSGVGGVVQYPRRRTFGTVGPAFMNLGLSMMGQLRYHRFDSIGQTLDMVLREGCGIAIFSHASSAVLNFSFAFQFTVESEGGGAGGYVFVR